MRSFQAITTRASSLRETSRLADGGEVERAERAEQAVRHRSAPARTHSILMIVSFSVESRST
jgi:hypothetical protein